MTKDPLRIAAVIVAGGRGARVGGDVPKQYLPYDGVPVIARTFDVFLSHPSITIVQPVIGAGDLGLYEDAVSDLARNDDGLLGPVDGGETRQGSVSNGLNALASLPDTARPDIVLVHDAARPFISADLIDRVIAPFQEGTKPVAGVIPVVPMTDTVKLVEDGNNLVVETLDRDRLKRVQTPQAFQFDALRTAHQECAGSTLPDDGAVCEQAGLPVLTVAGEIGNIKLTHAEDFIAKGQRVKMQDIRTGTGFDVHRFTGGSNVWLCGVEIPHDQTLAGHSDADVALHALTDALLGAIAAGDIGDHFPPSDPKWQGAASDQFLRHAGDLLAERGGRVQNLDVTIICERPKVGPHRAAMRARIAEILGIDVERVSVKATTTEKLGFTGRGEGIAAQAVATVNLQNSGTDA